MRIRVMASRHSAFYSPLLACLHRLRGEGHDVPYSVLGPGQRSHALIRDGEIDIMQSAVSSNWNAREQQRLLNATAGIDTPTKATTAPATGACACK